MTYVIENVVLIAIRREDGAQCFRWSSNPVDCMWLCGIDRSSGLKVGDKGRLVYNCTTNRGGYTFQREGE